MPDMAIGRVMNFLPEEPESEAKQGESGTSSVAADLERDELTGDTYYIVRIRIGSGEVAKLDGRDLVPGMPVETFLATSERTALSYLLKPLSDQFARAFRED